MKKCLMSIMLAVLILLPVFHIYAKADKDEAETEAEEDDVYDEEEEEKPHPIIIGEDSEDVLPLNKYTSIDDIVDVKPGESYVQEQMGAYGETAGDKNKFLIVDLTVCNISLDELDLSKYITAQLSYNDRYKFDQYDAFDNGSDEFIIGRWDGEWMTYQGWEQLSMEFTRVDDEGNVSGRMWYWPWDNPEEYNRNYEGEHTLNAVYDPFKLYYTVKGLEKISGWSIGEFRLIPYGNDVLVGSISNNELMLLKRQPVEADELETKLDILEETDYQLIFKCPNRVIEDLENCVLYVQFGDSVYEIPLE